MSALDFEDPRAALLAGAAATILGKIRRAREDFAAFFELVWHDRQGQSIQVQPFQREWLRALDCDQFVLLLAARGHGKSELIQARILWELGRNPELLVLIVCQSDKKAKETLRALKEHLDRNQLLHMVFPGLRRDPDGEWSANAISVKRVHISKHPSVVARGLFSTVTGARSDLIVADDPIDFRTAILQPQLRDIAYQKFTAEWLFTLEPKAGRAWVVATPWHHQDMLAKIEANKEWRTVRTPVGTDQDPFAPLFPTRYPREALLRAYRVFGATDYERGYRLKALTDDQAIIRPAWFQKAYYDAAEIGDPRGYFCVVGIDPAISLKPSADYFACVVLLYDAARNLTFVVNAWRTRLSFLDQAHEIVRVLRTWSADRVAVEAANYEQALAQYVDEIAQQPIPVVTVKPRMKLAQRLQACTPLMQEKRLRFHPKFDPDGPEPERLAREGDLVSTLLKYPDLEHDDLIGALCTGLEALREVSAEEILGRGELSSPQGGTAWASA